MDSRRADARSLPTLVTSAVATHSSEYPAGGGEIQRQAVKTLDILIKSSQFRPILGGQIMQIDSGAAFTICCSIGEGDDCHHQ